MSAPKFAPTPAIDDTRFYSSPPVVARAWVNDRPGAVKGFQPEGDQLGYQGPDQGFALKIAAGFRDRLRLVPGEHADDAVAGCLGLGLRRASMFSRAPVVHDLTIAFTLWGFLDADAPAELVAARRPLFSGLAHGHHYSDKRSLVDMVPESTLRLTPQQVASDYTTNWKALVGL
jgi:hypothetical protein